ncbi:MAG: glycosyl transferase, group 1 [uncultured bacterium]|nr:MAG: glycosyl transferase, group 1 [uncultured bacterium]
MKILHLIDHVGFGGAQTILKSLFEFMQSNTDIYYFALRDNSMARVTIHHKNVSHSTSYSKYSLKPLFEINKIIKLNNIQLLHCHLFRSQVFGWLIKKFINNKLILVFHEHGEIFRDKWWFILLQKMARKEIDAWIAVSNSTKKQLIENIKIFPNKIFVLYNFADDNLYNPESLEKINRDQIKSTYHLQRDDFVIGFLGRLNEIKSLPTLIDALSLLPFQFVAIIAGQGPEQYKLELMANRLGLYNKIRFINFQKNILPLYAIIDLLVLPSRSEASPMIFYESQMLGLPMIASDMPALNELIHDGDNGVLFPFQNSKVLAQKITKLHSDKSLYNHIKQQACLNGSQFTLKAFIKNLNAIYVQIKA